MSEKQFDIFDDQFKKAAEQYEPEFSEAAWQKMEAKLNDRKRRRIAGWWWWISDALIISVLIYMAVTFDFDKQAIKPQAPANQQEITSATKPNATQGSAQPGAGISQGETGGKANVRKPASAAEPANATVKQNDSERNKTTPARANLTTGKQQQNLPLNKIGQTKPHQTDGSNSSISTIEDGIAKTKAATQKESSSKDEIQEPKLARESNDIPKQATMELPNEPAFIKKVEPVTSTPAGSNPQPLAVKQSKVQDLSSPADTIAEKTSPLLADRKTPVSKGFFLHAGFAPEKSYIKGNNIGPLTLTFGGGFGYRFNNRLSVLAGIYSSQKNYKAGPNDYKPKRGSYYWNLALYSVNAECRITEIPVAVNYTFLNRRRHAVYAGLGFASLIMKKEWYDYHYVRSNGSYGRADYTYRTNNFHLFATTMLSAGYQFKVDKKLSLTAAPYLKLPLYGVGEGGVKIRSAGVMFGGVYNLPR